MIVRQVVLWESTAEGAVLPTAGLGLSSSPWRRRLADLELPARRVGGRLLGWDRAFQNERAAAMVGFSVYACRSVTEGEP